MCWEVVVGYTTEERWQRGSVHSGSEGRWERGGGNARRLGQNIDDVGLRRKCHVSLLDKIRQITVQNTENFSRARQMSPVRLDDWATRVVLGET